MAGHVEHAEHSSAGAAMLDAIAALQAMGQMLDRFAGRAVHGHGLAIQQIGHPADMVVVMVRE